MGDGMTSVLLYTQENGEQIFVHDSYKGYFQARYIFDRYLDGHHTNIQVTSHFENKLGTFFERSYRMPEPTIESYVLELLPDIDGFILRLSNTSLPETARLLIQYPVGSQLNECTKHALVGKFAQELDIVGYEMEGEILDRILNSHMTPTHRHISDIPIFHLRNAQREFIMHAIRGLVGIHTDEACKVIVNHLLEPANYHQDIPLNALRYFTNDAAVNGLSSYLPIPLAKKDALQVLGYIGTAQALNSIIGYLSDEKKYFIRPFRDLLGEDRYDGEMDDNLEIIFARERRYFRKVALNALKNNMTKHMSKEEPYSSFISTLSLEDQTHFADLPDRIGISGAHRPYVAC
jgi:hypothetical protein